MLPVYKILGCKINLGSFEDAFSKFKELLTKEESSQIITINPEMITNAQNDSEFKTIIDEAELIIPDGIGVTLALRMKGISQTRIPGVDFSEHALEYCAQNNLPVALIGAKEEIIKKAKENLEKKYLNLNIVFYHNGYFEDDSYIVEKLQELKPRLLLVGLGSPRQEKIIYKYKKILKSIIMIGVGGSLDIYSGEIKRAPEIYQKLGLEWFYRLIKQPERFSRIFPAIPIFLLRVILTRKEN